MKLMRSGWSYLADDLILLHESTLYPNPQSPGLLDYLYLNRDDEHYTLRDYPRLFLHLLRNPKVSYPIAAPAPLHSVALLRRSSDTPPPATAAGSQVDESVLETLLAINRLERLNRVDYDDALGRFMLHLNQVEGADTWDEYWATQYQAMKEDMSGLACREITIGPDVTPDVLDTFEQMLK